MDSFERFEEQEIPPIKALDSKLKAGKFIEPKKYNHARKVFNHFKMKTLQQYHEIHLLQHIFRLADVLVDISKDLYHNL